MVDEQQTTLDEHFVTNSFTLADTGKVFEEP
jgi:hypothetical protein